MNNTAAKSRAEQMAYEYAESNQAKNCNSKVDHYLAGFRACVAEAERLAFASDGSEFPSMYVDLEDLKKLVGDG